MKKPLDSLHACSPQVCMDDWKPLISFTGQLASSLKAGGVPPLQKVGILLKTVLGEGHDLKEDSAPPPCEVCPLKPRKRHSTPFWQVRSGPRMFLFSCTLIGLNFTAVFLSSSHCLSSLTHPFAVPSRYWTLTLNSTLTLACKTHDSTLILVLVPGSIKDHGFC